MHIGASADIIAVCLVLATFTGTCSNFDVKPVHLLFCCICTWDMAALWARPSQVMHSIIALYVFHTAAA
jgi:hypothetical protein